MTKHLTILLIIIFAAAGLRAQTKVYPIQVTISGSSDISPELSELYGIKSTLMFTFQCLDRKETNLPVAVKVRLYPASAYGKAIENTLQTGRKTFDMGFGQTIIEQKGDLEKYFLNEYSSLSQAGYYQNGQLAEGNYILQVVCYDARTITRQISNVAKIYLHIDQFNYPTLLFPRNNTDLEQYTTKPTISFQWTYYGKTDPKIRYRFELWEVINATTVETYVKQNNPIFVDDDIFVTQKSYMPELLQLKIGQKYCWRVTAYDPDHKLPFKRGGESDVYQFQYLNPPVPVTGLANKVTGKQIKYTWNADRNHTKYYVEYYDYKRDTTISSSQQDNTVTLTAPEYDYRIKFRVRAESYGDPARVSEYTPWSEAYVQPEKKIDFECGKQFPDREIANQELKTTFFEGEIVESKNGDSRYEIIKATARPDGSLDGKFYAIMDCWSGAKILCDFWDTKINTDNIILTTRYRSEDIPGFVADPEEIKQYVHELVNNVHMAATDNKIRDTILINQKFDYLYAENGRLKAVVVDNNGEPQVTDVTPDKPYSQSLITDGQGDTLVVSKKGQVMGVKEYKFAGDDRHLLNEYHRQLDSLGEWQINFNSAKEKQTYAFDQIGSGNHGIFATDEYYPTSGNYDFRYKSVECGQTDRVIVDFGSYPQADSVVFKDKYGVKLKVVDGNILSFTGVSQPDTNYIYAYRGDKKIGKLFLNTYQRKIYNVVLVSVNEAKILHEKNVDKAVKKVEESLNKVYNQCAVSFKITHADISIDDLTSFSHGGSGILTVYNDDQKKVLQAYEKEKKMKDGVFYLFFIDNVTDKKDGSGTPVSGYMPRGYNAGFIYDGGSPHTIAHELGHGIAGLEHVFENSTNSGKTANLMDYANGEQLWHFQWDQIQDPGRVWMKWSKDESEGEGKKNFFMILNGHTYANKSDFPIIINDSIYSFKFVDKNNLINEDSLVVKLNDFKLDIQNDSLVFTPNVFSLSKDNKLHVFYNDKLLFVLNVLPYYPVLNFSKTIFYDGSFLFDDYYSFNSDNLLMYSMYKSFITNYDNKKHYVPYLGLEKDKRALLSLSFDNKNDYELARKDSNFVFYLSADLPILTINGLSIKQITNTDLVKPQIDIEIQATNYGETTINIEDGDKNIYGRLDFICHEIQYRKLHLVFVNFQDSNVWQSLNPKNFENYINNNCMNQLFTKFIIDTIHYTSGRNINNNKFHEYTYMQLFLLDRNSHFTILDAQNFIDNIPFDEDYHFLPSATFSKTGHHFIGSHFGYNSRRIEKPNPPQTQEELIAHELGHWLGLHHPFNHPNTVDAQEFNSEYSGFIVPMSTTNGNFMDYNCHRTYWLKYQMRIVQDFEWEPILELEDWMK